MIIRKKNWSVIFFQKAVRGGDLIRMDGNLIEKRWCSYYRVAGEKSAIAPDVVNEKWSFNRPFLGCE